MGPIHPNIYIYILIHNMVIGARKGVSLSIKELINQQSGNRLASGQINYFFLIINYLKIFFLHPDGYWLINFVLCKITDKILFLRKNFDFLRKFRSLRKISSFEKNFEFFGKNFHFWEKIPFLGKNPIFRKKSHFQEKIRFLRKIRSLRNIQTFEKIFYF